MSFKHCLPIALVAVSYGLPVVAEVGCSADLRYSWKRASDGVESKTLFRRIEAVGTDEAVAKQQLQEAIVKEGPRALSNCRERHENITGCVATRFAQHQSTLAGMSLRLGERLKMRSRAIVNLFRASAAKLIPARCRALRELLSLLQLLS